MVVREIVAVMVNHPSVLKLRPVPMVPLVITTKMYALMERAQVNNYMHAVHITRSRFLYTHQSCMTLYGKIFCNDDDDVQTGRNLMTFGSL